MPLLKELLRVLISSEQALLSSLSLIGHEGAPRGNDRAPLPFTKEPFSCLKSCGQVLWRLVGLGGLLFISLSFRLRDIGAHSFDSGRRDLSFPRDLSHSTQLFCSPGTLLLARSTLRSSPECPTPECSWSAQPQSVLGVPTPE